MVGTGNKPGLDNPLEQCSEFEENLQERIKKDLDSLTERIKARLCATKITEKLQCNAKL